MIRSIFFLFLLAAGAATAPTIQAQQKCDQARDYVVQAREKARPGLSSSDLKFMNLRLKRADQMCPGMGDVYYYRYLYESQLGNKELAKINLDKARDLDSELLRHGTDPFAVSSAEGRLTVSPTVREKWALVVGISKFGTGIAPLQFPAKDASDFAALLRDSSYGRFKTENVKLLTDAEATQSKIKEGLNWLARSADKDDLVVVFVSSHGSPREFDTDGVSYVITYDTDARNPDSLYGTALPMVELVEAVGSRIKAQRAVVLLDTCFSGAAAEGAMGSTSARFAADSPRQTAVTGSGSKALVSDGAGVSNAMIKRMQYAVGRVLITASQPNERSWESERLRNGYFTYFLIDALKQNGGRSSIEQAFAYIKVQVPSKVQAEKGVSQTPMISFGNPKVEIIIGVDPQKR